MELLPVELSSKILTLAGGVDPARVSRNWYRIYRKTSIGRAFRAINQLSPRDLRAFSNVVKDKIDACVWERVKLIDKMNIKTTIVFDLGSRMYATTHRYRNSTTFLIRGDTCVVSFTGLYNYYEFLSLEFSRDEPPSFPKRFANSVKEHFGITLEEFTGILRVFWELQELV